MCAIISTLCLLWISHAGVATIARRLRQLEALQLDVQEWHQLLKFGETQRFFDRQPRTPQCVFAYTTLRQMLFAGRDPLVWLDALEEELIAARDRLAQALDLSKLARIKLIFFLACVLTGRTLALLFFESARPGTPLALTEDRTFCLIAVLIGLAGQIFWEYRLPKCWFWHEGLTDHARIWLAHLAGQSFDRDTQRHEAPASLRLLVKNLCRLSSLEEQARLLRAHSREHGRIHRMQTMAFFTFLGSWDLFAIGVPAMLMLATPLSKVYNDFIPSLHGPQELAPLQYQDKLHPALEDLEEEDNGLHSHRPNASPYAQDFGFLPPPHNLSIG